MAVCECASFDAIEYLYLINVSRYNQPVCVTGLHGLTQGLPKTCLLSHFYCNGNVSILLKPYIPFTLACMLVLNPLETYSNLVLHAGLLYGFLDILYTHRNLIEGIITLLTYDV